jgi:hypothetical protein
MGKASVRIAHFLISLLSGILMGYSFYYFRPRSTQYEAAGAGLIVALMVMLLLPRLHKGGGGGGDF